MSDVSGEEWPQVLKKTIRNDHRGRFERDAKFAVDVMLGEREILIKRMRRRDRDDRDVEDLLCLVSMLDDSVATLRDLIAMASL